MASNCSGCSYGVRRCETAPSLAALWLDIKKQRFSCTNQKPELPRPFGTGPLKPCPQGLFFAFLTFLRPNFFHAHLDFSPAPLTATGSSRMWSVMHETFISKFLECPENLRLAGWEIIAHKAYHCHLHPSVALMPYSSVLRISPWGSTKRKTISSLRGRSWATIPERIWCKIWAREPLSCRQH